MPSSQKLLLGVVRAPRLPVFPEQVTEPEVTFPLGTVKFHNMNMMGPDAGVRCPNENVPAGVFRIASVLIADLFQGSADCFDCNVGTDAKGNVENRFRAQPRDSRTSHMF